MKKLLLGSMALAAMVAGPAMAADMPIRAPLPVAAFSWTGWYVGLNAGGFWGQERVGVNIDPSLHYFTFGAGETANINFIQSLGPHELTNSGFTGGGQFGYNLQRGIFVWGVEVDFESFRVSGTRNIVSALPPAGAGTCATSGATCPFVLNHSYSANWLSTQRVRVGATWDRWLVYGTIGLAVSEVSFNGLYADQTTSPPQVSATLLSNLATTRIRWGFAGGGGLEWAIANNWSLRAEYLYIQIENIGGTAPGLPRTGVTAPCTGGVGGGAFCSSFTWNAALAEHIARFAINYKFDWAAPVVARY